MSRLKRNLGFLFTAIGIVMVWRGVWGLLDTYLFPDNLTLSFIISIIVGIIILFLVDFKKFDISELK